MQLKLDEAGHAVISDGKPVYVHDDGKEVPIDAPAMISKIAALNAEAKSHREAKEAAVERLKAFDGIEDADAALKALETIKNLDEGKLVQAGKVEEIKAAAKKAAEEQVAATNKAHATELDTLRKDYESLLNQYNGEKIGAAFSGSKFISDKAAIPADLMQARFGAGFKVEDGRIVGYDQSNNKIYSRTNPGEVAGFDEAIETMVESYAYRDSILKGANNGGGGARPGAGSGSKTLTRAQFDSMTSAERTQKMSDGFTISG